MARFNLLAITAIVTLSSIVAAQGSADTTSAPATTATAAAAAKCTQHSMLPNGQVVDACITETTSIYTTVTTVDGVLTTVSEVAQSANALESLPLLQGPVVSATATGKVVSSASSVPVPEGIYEPLPGVFSAQSTSRGVPQSPPSMAPYLPVSSPYSTGVHGPVIPHPYGPSNGIAAGSGTLPYYPPYATGTAGVIMLMPHPYSVGHGNWTNAGLPVYAPTTDPTTLQTMTRTAEL